MNNLRKVLPRINRVLSEKTRVVCESRARIFCRKPTYYRNLVFGRHLVSNATSVHSGVKSNIVENPGSHDLIIADIRAASTAEELLQVIEKHSSVMNNTHLLRCMEGLTDMVKPGSSTDYIVGSQAFKTISLRLIRRMRLYNASECVTLLRCAAILHIQASSSLVQSMCQILRSQVNHLGLRQTMLIHYFLGRIPGTSVLSDSLRLAMPIVFQTQCAIQLDTSSLDDCVRALLFALDTSVENQTLHYIASAVKKHISYLNAKQALSIVMNAGKQEGSKNKQHLNLEPLREVIQSSLRIIATELPNLQDGAIRAILSNSYHQVYCKEFYNGLWDLAISRNYPFSQICILLESSLRHDHLTEKNVYWILEKILQEKDLVLSNEGVSVTLLCASLAAFVNQHVDGSPMAQKFREAGQILSEASRNLPYLYSYPGRFIEFLRNLGFLGIFPKEHLDTAFNESFQQTYFSKLPSRYQDLGLIEMHQLEECLRINLGEENSQLFRLTKAVRELVKRAEERQAVKRQYEPLWEGLKVVLGGDQFLVRGAYSPVYDVRIDALLAVRAGGYPIAIGNTNDPLKGLPNDSKAVALLFTTSFDYLQASGIPKIELQMKLRTFKAEKLLPFVINIEKYKSLLEHERVPYVMRELKQLVDNNDLFSASKGENLQKPEKANAEKPL